MSLHHMLTTGYPYWASACFMASPGWEWSDQHPRTQPGVWPWALLFVALALGQLTVGAFAPDEPITEIFGST
jgi:hypothetical protein